MLSRLFLFIILVFRTLTINAQAEKIIVITLDGMRWQEVFKGADTALMSKKEYVTDSSDLANDFWDNDLKNRRKKLFHFYGILLIVMDNYSVIVILRIM